jgi:hypothetical protein
MAKIGLQRPRVMPSVGQRKAAGVSQHMRMRLKAELGLHARGLDHAGEASGAERRAALRGEDERRFRLLLALQPPQRPQLVAEDWMGAGRALLDPTNVQGGRPELDLIPAQVNQLARPQAMPVGHQDGSWWRRSGPSRCGWLPSSAARPRLRSGIRGCAGRGLVPGVGQLIVLRGLA